MKLSLDYSFIKLIDIEIEVNFPHEDWYSPDFSANN